RHYHPSNALFATFGNIPAVEHQARFEALALSRFERQRMDLPVHDEKRYHAPVRVQQAYPVNPGEPLDGRTHIVMGWLLGHSFDLEQNLEAHLLSSVLMENSASPLMKALETSDLGASPSPLCGLEDSNREMTFVCGLEGSEPERQADLEQLVETVLREVVEQGVSQERLEAVLHQLELHQREISGDHYPYGLQLILTALSPMVHGGDPVGLLDLVPVLARLREKIKAPDYVPDLVRRLLLDNPHRVTLTLVPDADIEARRHAAVERALAARKARMSSAEQQAVIELAEALKVRQERKDDESVLPRVGIEDVPVSQPEPLPKAYPDVPITGYGQGTNGLVYQQIALPLPALNEDDQALLSIYTTCIAETGCGDLDYLAMQDRLSAYTGGVGAYASVKGRIDDVQQVDGYLIYSSKSLLRNHDRMSTILRDVVER
ncbi:MAG: insulinase family protein, partial [Gammaproteobacteria bacterium]|nr:insulinase family protein [Gammaproteobacteria bacterium]